MKKFFLFLLMIIFSINISFAELKTVTLDMASRMVFGRINDNVKTLQSLLFDFGYYQSDKDKPVLSGKFDEELRSALKEFQESNGLKVNGYVDPATVQMLNKFSEHLEPADENKNSYLDSEQSIDSYGGELNYENGIDQYKGGMEYKSDFLDYYKDIPFIKDVSEIISPVKSTDEHVLHLNSPEDLYPEDQYYYFEGDFNFLDCLADKRCIDLEALYVDEE